MTLADDPALQALRDQDDRRAVETIRRHGVRIMYIGGPDCDACAALNRADRRRRSKAKQGVPFAYTIGLFGLRHPELLVFGVDPDIAHGLLNTVSARVRKGRDLAVGEVLSFEGWPHRALVEAVPDPGEILFEANRFYQRPREFSVEALQLTLDDRAGRFPGQAGYSAEWVQPRPGRFRA